MNDSVHQTEERTGTMRDIGKILPVEGYHVVLKGSLPSDYTKALTHLYQPLIGIQAITLYQTLISELDFQNGTTFQTHHTLMNYMNLPLDDIYRARVKLEGIGLLRTYQQESGEHNSYIYDLQRPFAPAEFFTDDMLTQLLYHHIGEAKFKMLQEHFQSNADQSGTNITASFNDVFQTFQPQATVPVMSNGNDETEEHVPSIDFSWMEKMLKSRMIPPHKVLTPASKKLMSQMMTLYDLAEFEVEKAVLWALSDENTLASKEFKEACHDLFQTKHQQSDIRLTEKADKPNDDTTEYTPTTKEEQLIQNLEKKTPKQLLEDLSSGGQASGQDLKMIRDVMAAQGLPSSVMNVLIHYVLLQSNMKLSKAYMETIASHWSRANLKTAREAMAFAKKQKNQYQQRQNKSKNQQTSGSKEVIPDWFKERKKTKPDVQQNQVETEQDNEEFASLLREFSNGKQ